eukprot:s303_g6.t1
MNSATKEPLPEGWKAYGTFFSPTVDGVQLTALPWQLLSSGAFYRDAHVMLGFNKDLDEGTVLASCEGTPKCELLHKGSNMTKADFELLLTTDMFNISSDKIDDVLAVYADASNTSSTDWYWTATKVYGDYAIACPSLRAAHQIAKMSSKEPQGFLNQETFLYEFCQTPRAHAPSWAGIFGQAGTVGASHAAELGFVWLGGDGWQASQGASEGGWPLSDKEEWLLAKTIAAYWTNFAKTGNPNRPKGEVRTSMTIPWTSLSADEKLKDLRCLLERRCELIDSFGPMVEGYTMDRRLHEDSPISQAVPVLVTRIGIRRHALDQSLAEQPSQAVTAAMRLEELPTSRLALSQAFEPLMVDAETRYRNQGGVIRDESPFYCKHCFQPIQRQADSKEGAEELGPFAQSWLDSVQEVLEDSAVAAHEIAAWSGSHDPTMLRAPHAVEVEKRLREKAEPWEDIRKAKPPCSCRDVFCRKDLPVDGETLVIGTVYTFRLRVYDGFRWSPWTEHCPAVQVLRPLLKDSLPATPTAGLAGEDMITDSQLEGRNGLDGRFQTEMGLEVEARFGSLLFKGQGAIPAGSPEKVVLEAGAVSFVDEHRNLPKATPLLTNPGGDPWPIGAEPKKFIMRTKARTVYADRLPDSVSRDNDIDLSLPPSFPEDRPHNDDFREDSLDRKWR